MTFTACLCDAALKLYIQGKKPLCIVTGGPIVKVKTKADGPRVVSLAQGGGFN